jgi:hypothetical protein
MGQGMGSRWWQPIGEVRDIERMEERGSLRAVAWGSIWNILGGLRLGSAVKFLLKGGF